MSSHKISLTFEWTSRREATVNEKEAGVGKLQYVLIQHLIGLYRVDDDTSGLKKNPIRLSGTSRFSLRASNFLSFLARQARTQASCSLTKFLIMILRRKGKL